MIRCGCCNKEYKDEIKLKNHFKYMKERNTQLLYTLTHKKQKQFNSKKHRIEHPKYYTDWRLNNKEKINNYQKVYNILHRLEKSKYMKNYHIKNSEISSKYYQTNREEVIKKIAKYQKTFNGKLTMRAAHNKRRVILMTGKNSELTKEKVQSVYENNIKKYGTLTCCLCFKPIKFGEDSLEHNIPITRHKDFPNIDLNDINNLGIAHRNCNTSKYNKTLDEWFKSYLFCIEKVEK